MKKLILFSLLTIIISCNSNFTEEDVIPLSMKKIAKDYLAQGERLNSGESIYSSNGKYQLILQTDGNLVIYDENHTSIWATNMATYGKGDHLDVQFDGNLVVYDKDHKPLWSTGTYKSKVVKLILTDNGNLILFDWTPQNTIAVWTSKEGLKDYIAPNEYLYPGQVIYSKNGKYQLELGYNGNLVFSSGSKTIWSSRTTTGKDCYLHMTTYNELYINDKEKGVLWSFSGRYHTANDFAAIFNRNFALITSFGAIDSFIYDNHNHNQILPKWSDIGMALN